MLEKSGRLQALGCALLLAFCFLISRPWAEIGVNDDWSYIRTAQIFAQTGHIVFNGWATAALGWQVWLGALFIRLFGFSFTAVRASMLPVALLATFVLHRTLVRLGATQWNATVGTVTLMVSPLVLPLAVTFHTDLPAYACILAATYSCARVLRAGRLATACFWLALASLAGDMGGVNRQIAWLAALVMVPCTVFVSQRRRQLWPLAAMLFVLTLLTVVGTLHWLAIHPHTVPERVVQGRITNAMLHNLLQELERNLAALPFYLFPLCIAFLPALPYRRARTWAGLAVAGGWLLQLALRKLHQGSFHWWLTPSSTGVISLYGAFFWGFTGHWPILLSLPLQVALTAVTWLAGLAFAGTATAAGVFSPVAPPAAAPGALTTRETSFLLLPFALCYLVALLPRACFFLMMDRYLLPLLFCAAVGMIRLYQHRVARQLPRLSAAAALLFAVFGTALVHDLFATQRAKVQAAQEVLQAGVPRTALSAGFEFDNWTQLLQTGYVTDYRVARHAPGDLPAKVLEAKAACQLPFAFLNPSLQPRFFLSYDPASCAGVSSFPALRYRTWLGGPEMIYVLRAGEPADGPVSVPHPRESF